MGLLERRSELAEQVRDALPGMELVCNCGGGGMKAQFKRADRSGAQYALVLGETELASGEVMLKPLRGGGEQVAGLHGALTGYDIAVDPAGQSDVAVVPADPQPHA